MEWSIIRPGTFPFGPRDRQAFHTMARAIEHQRAGYINGGRSLISTVYVKNLALGMRRLTGYQPMVGMDEAIRRSVASYRAELRDS